MFPLQPTAPPAVPDSILAQTARGAGWTIGWRVVTRFLGLISTLILVRLLIPGDFGLVALATGFSQAISQLSALGIEEAVIRERAPTRDTYDTAFTISLICGLLSSAIIVAGAWPAALFFRDPRLTSVLMALAACSLVTSFENMGTIEFRRDFAFAQEFKLLLLPRLGAMVMTISVAVLCRSYWALVIGIATGKILWVGMGYAMHPHRPRLTLRAWRSLASFSAWSWAISMVTLVRDRVDSFVIGSVLNLTQVGIYSVGSEIATIPTYELAAPLSRACLPGFAAVLRSGVGAADSYLRIIASVTLFMLPAGIGISLVAEPVVLIALGPQWSAATGLVRIMGIASITFVLGTVTYTMLAAHGLIRATFVFCAVSMLVRLASMILLVTIFGLTGAAIGWSISIITENILYMVVAFRRFDLRAADMVRQIWRGGLASVAMATVLVITGLGWSHITGLERAIWSLALAVPTGAVTYIFVLVSAWFLCGCPTRTGESDMLELLRRIASQFSAGRESK